MLSDDEFFTDESLLAAIEERAKNYGIDIPSQPELPVENILFALKPAHYSLEDFHTYMNLLFDCYWGKSAKGDAHKALRAACIPKMIFFCLNASLKAKDLNFLFEYIIKVKPLSAIPTDATGESLVHGKLLSHFTPEDYDKIVSYIDSARKRFKKQLSVLEGVFDETPLRARLGPLLDIDGTFSWKAAALNVYPQMRSSILKTIKKIPSNDYVDDDDDEVDDDVARAFDYDYLYSGDISSTFIAYVKEVLAKSPNEFFASYAFLGQSSCMGKSRLLRTRMETNDTAIFLVYINCRLVDGEGFPKFDHSSLRFVARLLNITTEYNMTRTLFSFLSLAFKSIGSFDSNGRFMMNKEPKSYTIDDLKINLDRVVYGTEAFNPEEVGKMINNMYWLDTKTSVLKKVLPIIAFDEASCFIDQEFFEDERDRNNRKLAGIRKVESSDAVMATSVESKLVGKGPVSENAGKRDHDMGIEKLNTFRLIRRVLNRRKSRLWNCLFVFAGTNTRLGNFVPNKLMSGSTRNGFGLNDSRNTDINLFPPFIFCETWSIFAREFNCLPSSIEDWNAYVCSNVFKFHIVNYGRPIWGAMMHAALKILRASTEEGSERLTLEDFLSKISLGPILDNIEQLANHKLGYSTTSSELERVEYAIAIICLTAYSGRYQGEMTSKLVEKRMALLTDYRSASGRTRITYPSEPVLSLAALKILKDHACLIFEDLTKFSDFLFGDIGDIGEFIVCTLFLLATPEMSLNTPYCSAREFLFNIVGPQQMSDLENDKNPNTRKILKGKICLSHFRKYREFLGSPLEYLQFAVLLHCGFYCPNGFRGVDAVIPVILEDGKLGMINTQAKSLCVELDKTKLTSILKGLADSADCSIPHLDIIVNISPFSRNIIEIGKNIFDPNETTTILIEGLRGGFEEVHSKYQGGLDAAIQHMTFVGRYEKSPDCEKVPYFPFTENIDSHYKVLSKRYPFNHLSDIELNYVDTMGQALSYSKLSNVCASKDASLDIMEDNTEEYPSKKLKQRQENEAMRGSRETSVETDVHNEQ